MSNIEKNLKFYEQPVFINLILLIFNTIFFILKLIFGTLTRSLAIQADAFDSITDVVMCLTALIGILFAKKKPNEKFPYGYYKIENIISLIISLFIFVTAYYIILQTLVDLINFINGNPRFVDFSPVVFFFLIISLLTSMILTLYLKLVGKQTNSPIIQSEANEKLLDIFISASVLIGFISVFFNFYVLDSIIALFIGIFIIKGGYDIFIASTKTLLDAVIDFDNRTELYNLIEKFPRVKSIKNLQIRSYGKYVFLEVDIVLNKEMTLSKIRVLKDNLSDKIKKNFAEIFKIIILAEVPEEKIIKIAIPLMHNEGLNSKIFDHFGESPYFAFLEIQEDLLMKFEVIPNKFRFEEKRKGLLISDWLNEEKIDKIYLKKELKKGPSLIFNNNFVEVELTDLENLNEILNKEKITMK